MASEVVIAIFLLAAITGGSNGVYADESSETEVSMNTEQFHRHLKLTSAETFAHWTSDRATNAIPLELKLRSSEPDGIAYLAGYGSYAQFFVQGTQNNSTSTFKRGGDELKRSRYLLDAKIPVLNDVNEVNVEGVVSTSARRAHKLEETASKAGLRGQRHLKQSGKQPLQLMGRGTISLDSISFTDTEASFLQDADVQDHEIPSSLSDRELKRNGNTNKKNKENGQKINNHKKKQKGLKRPQITSVSPSADAGISDSQDFTIVAEPSPLTDAPITNVLFQITDNKGTSSSWIEVPKIGSNRYQLTIDGFAKHQGTKWRYKVLVEDAIGKKGTTGTISLIVNDVVGDANDRFVDESNSSEPPPPPPPPSPVSKPPPAPAQAMRKQVVSDKNWPHGGNIQLATGKILFEFRGQGDFVCSGTVIMDGSNGSSPNERNGRSIIQTAAHCVYNDVLKVSCVYVLCCFVVAVLRRL